MSGPLAQRPSEGGRSPLGELIAQAKQAMACHSTPIMSGGIIGGMTHDPAICSGCRGRAALSSLERHVQEMEKALRVVLDDVALVVDDHLSGCAEEREAAMPAFTRLMLVTYRDEENRHDLAGSIRAALTVAKKGETACATRRPR